MSAAASPTRLDEPHAMDAAVPSWKLMLTLGLAGAASGLLIVLLYTWTLPGIEAHKAGILRTAISQVLKTPSRCDTLYLVGGVLTATAPPADPSKHVERVYRGYDAKGSPIGYAIEATGPGFSETIRLIFGVNLQRHELLGMTVLDSKETPGIADDVERPVFTSQFAGAKAPVEGVKASAQNKPPGTIVMITGATIPSRSVLKAINTTLARWQPLLEQYERGGTH